MHYITVAALPAALEARGIRCSQKQAQRIATDRKLPFFKSPLGRELVITPELLDQALAAPAAAAERQWSASRAADNRATAAAARKPARR